MRLLDTDVMVDLMRGFAPAIAWFESLGDEEAPALPGFVAMELICGCRNRTELTQLQERLRPIKINWPHEQDLDQSLADLWTYRLSHGLKILDTLIGRCATRYEATLYMFNTKDFSLISGLKLAQPYSRSLPSP
jgi:predicted nucleic acid-binding protein